MKKKIRIFISSPNDVEVERQIAIQVIQRLNQKYANSLEIKPILWEREPLLASGHFQDALDPRLADIMVCMLWSRLGSPLPENFKSMDGRTGVTGSEWEFENGLQAYEETGKPELLVYRKITKVSTDLEDIEQAQQALNEKQGVQRFFEKHFHHEDELSTFKRAYFPFDAADEFEQLLESHLQPLLEKHIHENNKNASQTWFEGSPFLGLAAYDEKHHAIFFGRSRETAEIIAQYQSQINAKHNFLMISGMSGCGKSSITNAGIIPLIRTPRLIQYDVGYIDIIRVDMSSSADHVSPLLVLCQQVVEHVNLLNAIDVDAETLYEQITRSPKSLVNTCKQVANALKNKHTLHEKVEARIQLVLDQAEEIFTKKGHTHDQQVTFFKGIKALIKTGYVWCIGTIRSDFIGQGQHTPLYALMQSGGDYKLQPPQANQLRQILCEPANAAGVSFELNNSDISLADIILQDSQAQPGSLPLVAFCLDELFRLAQQRNEETLVLRHADYNEELGGLTGAISRKAELLTQQMQTDGVNVDALLPRIFNAMIQVNPDNPNEQATARTINKDYFKDHPHALQAIENYVAMRLIIAKDNSLRFAHETLLQSWQRIQNWLANDREFQTFKARIERDVSVWKQDKKAKSRLLNSGKPLSDASVWLHHRRQDLLPETQVFIEASINKQAFQRKRRIALVIGFILSLSALTAHSWFQQQQAIENEKIAILQQQRSENLLNEVRQNLEFMNNDLAEVLVDYVPTSERVRVMRRIDKLGESLFQQKQSQGALQTPEDLSAKALMLKQKADLISANDTQDSSQANGLYIEAFEIRQQIAKQQPENDFFQYDVADSYLSLAHINENNGDYSGALTAYDSAKHILKKLIENNPLNTNSVITLSQLYRDKAYFYSNYGEDELAMQSAKDALNIAQLSVDDKQGTLQLPDKTLRQIALYQAYNVLADMEQLSGFALVAIEHFEKAISIAEKLSAIDPKNTQILDNLNYYYVSLAASQQESVSVEQGLASVEKAVIVAKKLIDLDPQNRYYQQALSTTFFQRGRMFLELGDYQASIASYLDALVIDEALLQANSQDNGYLEDISHNYDALGVAYFRAGMLTQAAEYYSKAIDSVEYLMSLDPKNVGTQVNLAVTLTNLADLHSEKKEFEKAEQLYMHATQIWEDVLELKGFNAMNYDGLAITVERQGENYFASQQYDEALVKFQKMLDMLNTLLAQDPDNNFYRRNKITAYLHLGKTHHMLAKNTQAKSYFEKAIDLNQALVDYDKNDTRYKRFLFYAYLDMGDFKLATDQSVQALENYQLALQIIQTLLNNNKNILITQIDSSHVYEKLFNFYSKIDNQPLRQKNGKMALSILQNLAASNSLTPKDLERLSKLTSIIQ